MLTCAESNFSNLIKIRISSRKLIFSVKQFLPVNQGPRWVRFMKKCQKFTWHYYTTTLQIWLPFFIFWSIFGKYCSFDFAKKIFGVIDTLESGSAVALKPWSPPPWSQWSQWLGCFTKIDLFLMFQIHFDSKIIWAESFPSFIKYFSVIFYFF